MRVLMPAPAAFVALPAAGQERGCHCIAIADAVPGVECVQQADWHDAVPDDDTVGLHDLDRSMCLLQAPDGTTTVTDYTASSS